MVQTFTLQDPSQFKLRGLRLDPVESQLETGTLVGLQSNCLFFFKTESTDPNLWESQKCLLGMSLSHFETCSLIKSLFLIFSEPVGTCFREAIFTESQGGLGPVAALVKQILKYYSMHPGVCGRDHPRVLIIDRTEYRYGRHHTKRSLMYWVIVIPKEGWARGRAHPSFSMTLTFEIFFLIGFFLFIYLFYFFFFFEKSVSYQEKGCLAGRWCMHLVAFVFLLRGYLGVWMADSCHI